MTDLYSCSWSHGWGLYLLDCLTHDCELLILITDGTLRFGTRVFGGGEISATLQYINILKA